MLPLCHRGPSKIIEIIDYKQFIVLHDQKTVVKCKKCISLNKKNIFHNLITKLDLKKKYTNHYVQIMYIAMQSHAVSNA